ncbi:MAG: hypothetical protein EPN91_01910 [Salinibacterium sp.]|nr:MAG: hypothetical protein EPN91_01910 [Salinibacterium sp.]
MTPDADEDALTWAGDDKPEPDKPAPSAKVSHHEHEEAPPTSALVLIVYGILGGAYLIYTIGWVISIQRSTTVLPSLFANLMFRLGEGLAIGSPIIWFVAVFLLTRHRSLGSRLLWLLLGLAVVIPWSFVLGV